MKAWNELRDRLRRLTWRILSQRFLVQLAVIWGGLAALALAARFFLPPGFAGGLKSGPPDSVFVGVAAGCAALLALRHRPRRGELVRTATAIERRFPGLDARLLTALEQRPEAGTGRFNRLQELVIREALDHDRHEDWRDVVSPVRRWAAVLACAAAIVGVIGTTVALRHPLQASAAATAAMEGSAPATIEPTTMEVEPGDVEIERGSPLLVLARFAGPMPPRCTLLFETDAAEGGAPASVPNSPTAAGPQSVAMGRSLEDPVFAGRWPAVERSASYSVVADVVDPATGERLRSRSFRAVVYDLPTLEQADLVIVPPASSGLPSRTIENARLATVVEGSAIEVICRVNKPLASAALVPTGGEPVALQATAEKPLEYRAVIRPTKREVYALALADDKGRANRDREEFVFDILPNGRPQVRFTYPGRDTRFSPLQEVFFEGTAIDETAILDLGLEITLAGRPPITVPFGTGKPEPGLRKFSHAVALEDHGLQPGDAISYFAYADDLGPDGQRRRTRTDVFFAEVRPFDEAFWVVKVPGGGEGEEKPRKNLLKTQKEIIAATWKQAELVGQDSLVPERVADVTAIRGSQADLRQQLLDMMEEGFFSGPDERPYALAAGAAMERA
ncbi:MAG: hypothetical protein WCC69_15420, partial [Pirellulales bacterium]